MVNGKKKIAVANCNAYFFFAKIEYNIKKCNFIPIKNCKLKYFDLDL